VHPSGLCRLRNHDAPAVADENQSSRHILKVGIPYRTTGNRKEWVARGETTIQIMCKQHIGGATETKDQPGWTTDGPSVGWFPDQRKIGMFLICTVPMVC
jgi:hypothetical protein